VHEGEEVRDREPGEVAGEDAAGPGGRAADGRRPARDQEIARQATLAGYSVFWVAFVLACMAPFFIKGPNATVTIQTSTLCTPVFVGLFIVFTVRALVTVILYRRGAHGEEAA
jgi:hypothetical protein